MKEKENEFYPFGEAHLEQIGNLSGLLHVAVSSKIIPCETIHSSRAGETDRKPNNFPEALSRLMKYAVFYKIVKQTI